MARKAVLIPLLFLSLGIKAQNFTGMDISPYGGVYSVPLQPAYLGVTPLTLDGNLIGVSANILINDLVPRATSSNLIIGGDNVGLTSVLSFQSQEFFTIATIQMPSIAMRIDDRSGASFSWRIRGMGWGNISNSNLNLNLEGKDWLVKLAEVPLIENLVGVVNSWQEFNFSYGRVIWQQDIHRTSIGGTVKYLRGGASGYTEISGLKVEYDRDTRTITDINGRVVLTYNNTMRELYDGKETQLFKTDGWGLDLGVVHDILHTPSEARGRPYFIRISASVRDIGKVKYRASEGSAIYSLSLNQPIDENTFSNLQGIQDLSQRMRNTFDFQDISLEDFTFRIPTTLTVHSDWNFWDHMYLDLMWNMIAVDLRDEFSESEKWHNYQVTVHYDRPKFGAYLQGRYNKYLGWSNSIMLRYSLISLGISNFLKTRSNENLNSIGVTFVLRVPLLPSDPNRRSRIF